MLTNIGTGISSIIGWVGNVVTAIVDTTASSPGAWSALLPVFAIGISVSFVLLGVKIVKKLTYGA